MTIQIKFVTVVMTKDFVEDFYPGGLGAFLHANPSIPFDDHLVGVTYMSSQYAQELRNTFFYVGADFRQGFAVCCMASGPWEETPDIEFLHDDSKRFGQQWSARYCGRNHDACPGLGKSTEGH